ncbi:MAG TPA: DEAD/DEAH box helicase, partial [Patescibacteria group bacterium]|nr:DEAD/DEAH box helicase [Patescibacteria group bacterium]
MSQSSLFIAGEAPEAGQRAQVLVPYPLSRAYDYLVPQDMTVAAGDYVRVPLGKRDTIGVVWTTDAGDEKVDPGKLKPIAQKFTFEPMPQAHRQFIEWVARYTMSDIGSVLKMSLSAPEALQPPKSVPVFKLTENIPVKLPASRQKIVDLLKDGVARRAVDIARAAGCSAAVVRSMAAAGQLQTIAGTPPAPCSMLDVSENRLSFSPDQKTAADALQKLAAAQQFSAVLLDGVTGSGKTEVYFEAVAEALRNGKQALILLPEISLSTQFLERFERRFGVQPALWHSEVPTAQRRVTWTGVAEGKTKVVIGAR